MRHHRTDTTVQRLMQEATILGSSFVRTGNQTSPDDGSSKGANVAVTRNTVIGGVTVPLYLMERGVTNLATQLATGAYATTSTAVHCVSWNGGSTDYALTTNGAGTFSALKSTTNPVTGEVRYYKTLSGHASGDTITCTRAGSPTNTKLQMESNPHPTSDVAFSAVRGECKRQQTGLSPGDNGTVVALFQPFGWSTDLPITNTALFRVSTGAQNANLLFSRQDARQFRYTRAYNGGATSTDQSWAPIDGKKRLVAVSWTTSWTNRVRVSGRDTTASDGLTDGKSAPASLTAAVAGTSPIAVFSSLDIGSCYSIATNTQCNGWIALLYFARELTQDEVDQLAFAFEGQTGFAPEIQAWGDSLTAFSGGTTYPDLLVTTYRPGWRNYNGGAGGETTAQIKTRFLAHPRKWRGFTFFESQNSTDLTAIAAMVALLGHRRYLVLSCFNDSVSAQSGSSNYNAIMAANAAMLAAYGDWSVGGNYFDWRSYLITLNTGGDATDTEHDCIGASQRSDSLHLNSTGQLNTAAKLDLILTAMGYVYP